MTNFILFTVPLVSRVGRHTVDSIGRDSGLPQLIKTVGKSSKADAIATFANAHNFLNTLSTISQIINIGGKIHAGLMNNGSNSAINTNDTLLPYISQTDVSGLGKNDSIYHKTIVHVGRRTSSRIKKIQSGPFVETLKKSVADSSNDYQDHNKRKLLYLNCGFNEKGFSFLTEDHCFTVDDYYTLFKVEKRFAKDLREATKGVKDIYGCILKTYNQIKIKNRMEYYSLHLKIHLIKIFDNETDIRSLIQETTHNELDKNYIKSGKIPREQQYTDPDLKNKTNRFSINFTTNLTCRLSLSTNFCRHARIVRSWTATLPAGSIWEFNLNTHLGRGIFLNNIFDLKKNIVTHTNKPSPNKDKDEQTIVINDPKELKDIFEDVLTQLAAKDENQTIVDNVKETIKDKLFKKTKKAKKQRAIKSNNDHPTGYILCLEYVGDRRSTLQRNQDKDLFTGYSPCKMMVEFKNEISYLTNQDEEDELLVYKRSRQEKDFDDESDFKDIFCPDRAPSFHVPLEDIQLYGETKKCKYKLDYDRSLLQNSADFPDFLNQLKSTFKDIGLDPKTSTEDDTGFNFNNPPTPNEDTEYQGADTPPPPINN